VGRSKTSVDGWCGGRFEKAGDPKVMDSHQEDSFGSGI